MNSQKKVFEGRKSHERDDQSYGICTDDHRSIAKRYLAQKFNSMVIGWGGLGTVWGKTVFTVYVREHRYTKAQLDSYVNYYQIADGNLLFIQDDSANYHFVPLEERAVFAWTSEIQ